MRAIKLSQHQSRITFEHHFSLICLSFSSRGCRNTENIEKQWSSHIFMRNVISQIADPAQPAYQGVVRDQFHSVLVSKSSNSNAFKVNFWILCVYMQLSSVFGTICIENSFVWTKVDFQKFFNLKSFTVIVCCCFCFICSTSLPGGNQVDGLPPASSIPNI